MVTEGDLLFCLKQAKQRAERREKPEEGFKVLIGAVYQ